MKRLHHGSRTHRNASLFLGTFLACLSLTDPAAGQDDVDREYQRVFQTGYDAIVGGHLDESISAFKRCLELRPKASLCAYNLACAYSLKEEKDVAADWLHRAIEWGYDDLDHLEQDADLNKLRDHPSYQALVTQLRERIPKGGGRTETTALDETLGLIVMIQGEMEIAGTPTETFGAGILFGYAGDRVFVTTANHVVRQRREASHLRVMLKPMPGQWLDAHLMPHFDDELDLAVLYLDNLQQHGLSFCGLPVGRMGNAGTMSRGGAVYPVGYPAPALWGMPVSPDRISQIIGDQISFQSTFIAKGHSGGALLTEGGELLGMLQAEEPPHGLAVSIERIVEVLQQWGYPVQLRRAVPYARTALHGAAERRAIDEVRRLLDDCADPNAADSTGWTPLHEAAVQASAEAAELLIESGADVYAWTYVENEVGQGMRSRDWVTPLHTAAQGGATKVAEVLLRHGVNPDVYGFYREERREYLDWAERYSPWEDWVLTSTRTPLYVAAEEGALDVIGVLLASGAEVNAADEGGRTPLHAAAKNDHQDVARALMAGGADIEAVGQMAFGFGSGKKTPLQVAAIHDAPQVAHLLLEHGADVNAVDHADRTPLHFAAEAGSIETAKRLLAHGADVNRPGYQQGTPLHQAAAKGFAELAQLLLAHGAAVNATDENGRSAVYLALINGHTEAVKLLLEAGANPISLHLAVSEADVDAARLLLTAGARVDELDRGYTPIHRAAGRGQVEMVKLLLSAGADVNAMTPDTRAGTNFERRTPLHEAVERGHPEVVKLLLEAGADPEITDDGDRTALHIAAYEKLVDVLKHLLNAGADVHARTSWNGPQETPLLIVSGSGPVEAVRLLVAAGALLDEQDDRGSTPLHRAARSDWAEGVQLLLTADAPIDAADNAGLTPLHEAARFGSKEALHLLLEAGAKLEARTKGARTPLHLAAAEANNTEAVQALLEADADVNALDSQANTPLHIAAGARYDTEPTVTLLLEHGANPNARNKQEETPLSIALRAENYDIANLLRAHGGQE
jgi:ankyrin repeat protein/S1-C subfamily serine protease